MAKTQPVLNVIAGPNGSGKSTLIAHLAKSGVDFGFYINADDIAREHRLSGEAGSKEAQVIADKLRADCLAQEIDFTFETVMSHESKTEFMAKARLAGYQVNLFFVATSDPLLNVERVRTRVATGGHDVPVDRIIARYWRCMELLPQAILASDRTVIFDNSTLEGFRIVAHVHCAFRVGQTMVSLEFERPLTRWALAALKISSLGHPIGPAPLEGVILAGAFFVPGSDNRNTAEKDAQDLKFILAVEALMSRI